MEQLYQFVDNLEQQGYDASPILDNVDTIMYAIQPLMLHGPVYVQVIFSQMYGHRHDDSYVEVYLNHELVIDKSWRSYIGDLPEIEAELAFTI